MSSATRNATPPGRTPADWRRNQMARLFSVRREIADARRDGAVSRVDTLLTILADTERESYSEWIADGDAAAADAEHDARRDREAEGDADPITYDQGPETNPDR